MFRAERNCRMCLYSSTRPEPPWRNDGQRQMDKVAGCQQDPSPGQRERGCGGLGTDPAFPESLAEGQEPGMRQIHLPAGGPEARVTQCASPPCPGRLLGSISSQHSRQSANATVGILPGRPGPAISRVSHLRQRPDALPQIDRRPLKLSSGTSAARPSEEKAFLPSTRSPSSSPSRKPAPRASRERKRETVPRFSALPRCPPSSDVVAFYSVHRPRS